MPRPRAPRRARESRAPSSRSSVGLVALRRGGFATELLFLYACITGEVAHLRQISDGLGITVQAASHAYRQLARRGLVEQRAGRYRLTVAGVEHLHGSLVGLERDIGERIAQLHVIRSTRAVALGEIAAGSDVSLELVDGLLSARPGGRGASVGRAEASAHRGELVDVAGLRGIVRLQPGRIHLLTLPRGQATRDGGASGLRRHLREASGVLLGARGVDADVLLRRITDRPVARFGVASAAVEAARLGVSTLVLVSEEELPRLLNELSVPRPPEVTVEALRPSGRSLRDK